MLAAALVEGGTWRERVAFREALADPLRMRLALAPRLALLPAPAERLRLTVERFGPPHASDQRSLFDERRGAARERLREAVRQARAAAGPDAALRVLDIDPDSRVPERRVVLTPFELTRGMSAPRRLGVPRRARVHADAVGGRPLAVDDREVDAVRESWLVEDRWWTDRPLRRRYWEVVTPAAATSSSSAICEAARWFAQR